MSPVPYRDRPTWELVVSAAEKLTRGGHSPFKLEEVVYEVQRLDPTRGRGTIQPIVQGMTINAQKGPSSIVGKVLRREERGYYTMLQRSAPRPKPGSSSAKKRTRILSATELLARVDGLTKNFEACVNAFDSEPTFSTRQYELHRKTIDLLRRLGSVEAAVATLDYRRALRGTLAAWGMARGSNLVPTVQFDSAIRRRAKQIAEYEILSLEELAPADVAEVSDSLYTLIGRLGVVKSVALIVAGTKTLHHLLPDLVPPMDRAWTGSFFGWAQFDPQNNQEAMFKETFALFAQMARETKPSQYVGAKWRTSSTKILDNAVIGYCRLEQLGPTDA